MGTQTTAANAIAASGLRDAMGAPGKRPNEVEIVARRSI
jgi:hypothetical protein